MKTKLLISGYQHLILILIAITTLISCISIAGESSKENRMKKSGWIGVEIQDVNGNIAQKEKLNSDEGVYVKEVIEDSPADSAGIKEGDIMVNFNGRDLIDSHDLIKIVQKTTPGTKVNVTIVRSGEKKTIELTVGKKKEPMSYMYNFKNLPPKLKFFFNNQILGLELLTLNKQLGEYFGVPNNEGVLVEEVGKESEGEKAGFKAGDIIIRVGKKTIDKVEKIQKELSKYDEGDKVDIEILRKGTKKVLDVEIKEEQPTEENFFFNGPRMHGFHFDNFEGAGIDLRMDELLPKLENLGIELNGKMENFTGKQKDIQDRVQHCSPPQFESL